MTLQPPLIGGAEVPQKSPNLTGVGVFLGSFKTCGHTNISQVFLDSSTAQLSALLFA